MTGVKILVVDDEPSIREVVGLYLEEMGFDPTVVGDGHAALELIRTDPPDLLILDVMLPGVDGYEITRQVRANSAIPIILLTARADEIDRILGLEMGADDYVVKPFSPRELVSRVP
jgi:DNA-binding response OmpR family regulator